MFVGNRELSTEKGKFVTSISHFVLFFVCWCALFNYNLKCIIKKSTNFQ